MYSIIDSGTTNTRIFIIDDSGNIVASGNKKVGVRDTSITGSRDKLREGVSSLFFEIIKENDIDDKEVEFAIASGMITSEIGLIEIPHLIAPIGLKELSENIKRVEDDNVLPIGRPVYFIRGIKNNFPKDARVNDLRSIDFMRGEEVQCIGAIKVKDIKESSNIVALSSHTKIMHIDDNLNVAHMITTLSGQLFEAIVNSSNIGKSIRQLDNERENIYTLEEVIEIAKDCVENAGLCRCFLMPRFMETLLDTNSKERLWFLDAIIAVDDMKIFDEIISMGYGSNRYLFYGHKERCEIYKILLKKKYGGDISVELIDDKASIEALTIEGVKEVAKSIINNKNVKE